MGAFFALGTDKPELVELRKLLGRVYRARRRRGYMGVLIPEKLVQKRTTSSVSVEEAARKAIRFGARKYKWQCAPRARIAVTMHFTVGDRQVAELPKLVKFYLDLMKGELFTDDRQVEYLAAECRLPRGLPIPQGDLEIAIIFVERLSRYLARFDLFFELISYSSFREFFARKSWALIDLTDPPDHWPLNDYIDPPQRKLAQDCDLSFWRTFVGLDDENINWIRNVKLGGNQDRFLRQFTIMPSDRPHVAGDVLEMHPVCRPSRQPIRALLGPLASQGQSLVFERRVRDSISDLAKVFAPAGCVLTPFDVDVQVRSAGCLRKDLDNIILLLQPFLKGELMDGDAYLHGFRIYKTSNPGPGHEEELSLRLLSTRAISDFKHLVDSALEAASGWLHSLMEGEQ